jgi:uncharacterized protein (TIGR03067 family)
MSWLRALVLGVGLVAVSAAAADDEKKPGQLDPGKLVGTYKITDGKKAGEKIGDEAKKGAVIITKDTITLKGDGMTFVFNYKLDPKETPAAIDMEITEPDALKGAKAKGIIAAEKGEVTLCYHPEGKERPKKFESTKDNGYYLFTMKKEQGEGKVEKKKKDDQ